MLKGMVDQVMKLELLGDCPREFCLSPRWHSELVMNEKLQVETSSGGQLGGTVL